MRCVKNAPTDLRPAVEADLDFLEIGKKREIYGLLTEVVAWRREDTTGYRVVIGKKERRMP
jgi:hypothetical protein